MRVRHIIWTLAVHQVLSVFAADTKIDYSKAPGGGPAKLRSCAQDAFGWKIGYKGIAALGCQTIACICRPDLIPKAHDIIKDTVLKDCGEDATVDVTEAQTIYNDYCSANGFSVPGYTYIVTSTVPVTSDASPALATPAPLTSGVVTASPNTGGPTTGPLTALPSATAGTATVYTASPSRAIPVYTGASGPKPQIWIGFHLLYFAPIIPIKYIYAVAESLIVTTTASGPEPAGFSVVTSYTMIQTAPAMSTQVVLTSRPPEGTTKVIFVTKSANDLSPSGSSGFEVIPTTGTGNNSSGSGKGSGGLTKLEVLGIVIGIVSAMITTAATVWMCAGSRRPGRLTR